MARLSSIEKVATRIQGVLSWCTNRSRLDGLKRSIFFDRMEGVVCVPDFVMPGCSVWVRLDSIAMLTPFCDVRLFFFGVLPEVT